jgi:phosphosulfolactate phosphohydrolase-like enzyme
LEKLRIEKDIEYCLTPNQTPVVPVLVDGALVNVAS